MPVKHPKDLHPGPAQEQPELPGAALRASLLQESCFLHALMRHFPDRIYYKDLQSRFLYGSQSFATMFKLDDISQVYGKTDFDFFSEEHARAAFNDEQEIIRTGQPKLNMEEMETWPDGRVTWCSSSKAPFLDDDGNIIGTFGISRDITVRKCAQEALRESEARYRKVSEELATANERLAQVNETLQILSLTDPLTGLRNRRFLAEHMAEDIAMVERSHRAVNGDRIDRMKQNVDLLFLMVDLDHFKRVNDRYGHLAGDHVLQQVGDILRRAARTTDTVARVGGEEFLVVARATASADAYVMAERIRAAVEDWSFQITDKVAIRLTCSVGFSVYPLLMEELSHFSWEQVVEIADQCLYAAKRNGRNAWVGMIPDQELMKDPNLNLPENISELVRAGILPTISSLKKPIAWPAG
jgi:diguanylate cyclase (GGDEF)-like protein/PAS domain S-box-containing protein